MFLEFGKEANYRAAPVADLVADASRFVANLREKFAASLAARRIRREQEKLRSVPMTRMKAEQHFMAENGWTPWTITPANRAWLDERLHDVAADPRP